MVENVSDKQGQYPRRRPVVVVVGTAISQDTSHDAVHAANALKAARFEIITIAYNEQEIPDTAQPVGLLASPGFSFSSVTNVNELVGLLTSALCQANCFCLDPWYQWSVPRGDGSVVRQGECLRVSDIPLDFEGAKHDCSRPDEGGFVASEFSAQKHNFLVEVALHAYPGDNHFLIGLHRQKQREYVWMTSDGGTIPLSNADYTSWNAGFPNSTMGDCVAEVRQSGINTTMWESVSCIYLQRYVCQKAAYDTDNYLDAKDV